MKRGRPTGSKYKSPRTRKELKKKDNPNDDVKSQRVV